MEKSREITLQAKLTRLRRETRWNKQTSKDCLQVINSHAGLCLCAWTHAHTRTQKIKIRFLLLYSVYIEIVGVLSVILAINIIIHQKCPSVCPYRKGFTVLVLISTIFSDIVTVVSGKVLNYDKRSSSE